MRASPSLCGVSTSRGRPARLLKLAASLTAMMSVAALVRAGNDPPAGDASQPVLRRATTAKAGPPPRTPETAAPQPPLDRGILQRSKSAKGRTPAPAANPTAVPKPAAVAEPAALTTPAAAMPTPSSALPVLATPFASPLRPAAQSTPRVTPVAALEALSGPGSAPEAVLAPPGYFSEPFQRHPEPQYDEKPICSLNTNILPSRGDLPANYAAARFDKAGQEWHTVGTSRPWAELVYDWEATSFYCCPLYFEEPNAERVGHTAGNVFQPVLSGAHFFARIPALPYMLTAEAPWEHVYSLGHDRPGSYAPFRYIRLPLSVGAGVVQAGVVVGLVYLIP